MRILILLALSAFINLVDRGNLSAAAPLLRNELGLSPAQLGILLSSFFWTYAAFQIVSGWLVTASVPNWIFSYGYDSMGRLLDKDLSMLSPPVGTLYLDYTYDLLGDITSETGARGLDYYTYNTAARLTQVTTNYSDANNPGTMISAMHYNAFGGLTSDTLGDNEAETYAYVPKLTRLQSYTAKLNTTNIYSYNITSFAPNGDILAATDSANGNWTYSYDAFNRLVGSNKNTGQSVFSYVYDRFGNRWQQNGPNSMQLAFTGNNPGNPQNNNRMDGYSYDAAGNLRNDGTHNYTYDAENRIIQVDGTVGTCSSATACYAYDADGNRVQKISNVGSTGDPVGTWQFIYDQSGRFVQRFNGTLWQGNIFAGGRHVGMVGPGTIFSHSDWLGTERVRNQYSNPPLLTTCSSLPFGDGFSCNGGDWSPLHFTGKEHDPESGLDHFQFRKLSSAMGRFTSPDPAGMMAVDIESPQTLNRYTYVLNNPLSFTDPFGLDCAYLNSSGTGIEKGGIDQHSSSGECGKTGGYWVDGTITQANIDSNATGISLTGTTNGTDQTNASYRQDQVVVVGEYNNTFANKYNHIAFGLAGHMQMGQNPRSDFHFLWSLAMHGPNASVPGAIKPQKGGKLLNMVRIRATGMQAQMLSNAINQSTQNTPPYTIFGQTGCDCGTWVQQMLGDAGINSGPPAPLPENLMDQLNQLYPQQQQPPQ